MNHYNINGHDVNNADEALPSHAQRVLSKFPDREYTGSNADGKPTWKARCRAHDDNRASLSLTYDPDTQAMLAHCFACVGKSVRDLLAPVGLAPRDLFGDKPTGENGNGKSPVVIWYDYRDETGKLIFQVGRRAQKEDFPQRHPDGAGGWTWNMQGVKRLLYRLPEVLEADSAMAVYVVEGEKDVENLRALGLIATCNPGGAGKWKDDYSPILAGRYVVILEDNDAAGHAHAEQIARSVAQHAARVKVLKLPNLPDKGDVSDWLEAGGTLEKLEELATAAPEWTPPTSEGLPTIVVSDRPLRDKSDQAVVVLHKANQPSTLFVRSGRPARVGRDEEGRPRIDVVGDVELASRLTRCADFLKLTEKGYKHVSPPNDVVQDILALGTWPFPALQAVVEVPVLRPDGSILSTPGYDPATKLYYLPSPNLAIPPIPDAPTRQDVDTAAALITELLHDFKFADIASRVNTWGLLLTPIVRQATGLAQMALLDAPTPGSGKGLLAALVSLISTGRHAALISAARDDDEWRKRITSALRAGSTVINIDNVERRLDSAALCSVLTSEEWSDRLLGSNEQGYFPHRASWLATGNNIQPSGDLPRRCFWIRLDTKEAKPWERSEEDFLHPNLIQWTSENRGRLLAALLTLARAWYANGKPKGTVSTGADNFATWAKTVGGILTYAGVEGFLSNATTMFEQLDDDGAQWEAFLTHWYGIWQSKPVTVAEVAARLKQGTEKDAAPDEVGDAFRASLPDVLASAFAADKGFSYKLGTQLRSHRDRRFGTRGIRVERAGEETSGDSKGASKWKVVDNNTTPPPPRRPLPPPPQPIGEHGEHGEHSLNLRTEKELPSVGVQVVEDIITGGIGGTCSPCSPCSPTSQGLITNPEDLAAALPELLTAPSLALDTETTGLDPLTDRVRLIQMATPSGLVMVDCFAVDPSPLQSVIDQAPMIIGHNLKFDLQFLMAAGLTPPTGERLFDTMIAAQLLGAGIKETTKGYYGLGAVVERFAGIKLDKSEQTSDWSGNLTTEQLEYAAEDVNVLFPLVDKLRDAITEAKLERVVSIEMRALPAIAWLEYTGAPFNADGWATLADTAQKEVALAEKAMNALTATQDLLGDGTVNWQSSDQVKVQLEARGISLDSADDAALKAYADTDELCKLLLAHRDATKRAGAFGAKFLKNVHPKTQRIHASFWQLGSKAGRMSCSGPNLQQIPRANEYRACFRPAPGRCLIKADYSQIELRIAAEITKDARMLKAYQTGEDLHIVTAAAVMGKAAQDVTKADRQAAKALNFGLLYGMGAAGLREYALNSYGVILTESEAERFRARFFDTYPGLKRWHNARPRETVHTFTIAGRRRLNVDKFTEKLNSPVQGSGADILKTALALLWETRHLHPTAYTVLTIHDEVVVECDVDDASGAAAWLVDCMRRAGQAYLKNVPVEVEHTIATDWAGTPL